MAKYEHDTSQVMQDRNFIKVISNKCSGENIYIHLCTVGIILNCITDHFVQAAANCVGRLTQHRNCFFCNLPQFTIIIMITHVDTPGKKKSNPQNVM